MLKSTALENEVLLEERVKKVNELQESLQSVETKNKELISSINETNAKMKEMKEELDLVVINEEVSLIFMLFDCNYLLSLDKFCQLRHLPIFWYLIFVLERSYAINTDISGLRCACQ